MLDNQNSTDVHTFMSTHLIWWIKKRTNNNAINNKNNKDMKLVEEIVSGSRMTGVGVEDEYHQNTLHLCMKFLDNE